MNKLSREEIERRLNETGAAKMPGKDVERKILGGQTKAEVMGLSRTDPASQAQIAKIFAVGGELGLKKDEIKSAYGFDSFKALTVIEAIDIITRMETDLTGIPAEQRIAPPPKPEPAKPVFDATAFEQAEWTRRAGVNFVGGKVAKCGQCKNYIDNGCAVNPSRGKFEGSKMAPVVEDCFVFLYGPLKTEPVKEEEEDTDEPF